MASSHESQPSSAVQSCHTKFEVGFYKTLQKFYEITKFEKRKLIKYFFNYAQAPTKAQA